VFLPTAFMGGVPGLFFKQFGWTAVLAILASLMVARLLTPMMAAYIMRPARSLDGAPILVEPPDGPVMRAYLRVMQWCLRHRLVTAIGAGLFFVGSVSLVGLLPTTFIPPGDRGQTQVTIELAPGITLAQTERIAEQARKEIAALPHLVGIFSSIGGGSSGDAFAPGAAAEARRAVLTSGLLHLPRRPNLYLQKPFDRAQLLDTLMAARAQR
jgi:multidrug efflux pump subunit AcrB